MRDSTSKTKIGAMILSVAVLCGPAYADELTQRIQKDLVTLGYNPGSTDGEMSDSTVAAIAQFQAERNMPVTGEASPLLAGMISAEVSKKGSSTGAAATAGPAPVAAQDPAALKAAQDACLQDKINQAQAANKKKRGFGRLLSAVSRTASHSGNSDLAQTSSTVYSATATADDLSAAAKDLGLTEDDIAACQNPG